MKQILIFGYDQAFDIINIYAGDGDFYDYEVLDIYKLLAFASVISCCFIKYKNQSLQLISTEEDIKSKGSLNNLMLTIVNLKLKPISFTKVFVMGLINILGDVNIIDQNEKDYLLIMQTVLELLKIQKNDEAEKLKIELQDEVDCGFIEEEEDEEDGLAKRKKNKQSFDDESMFVGYEELAETLKTVENPASKEDEFLLFSNLINQLKQTRNDFLTNNFLNKLKKNDKEGLIDLMKTRRHKVGQREFVRHIVRIKRK